VPLIKLLFSRFTAPTPEANSSSIMDSRPYQLYCRRFYPWERLACQLRPNLLAFPFVALCQPQITGGGLASLAISVARLSSPCPV